MCDPRDLILIQVMSCIICFAFLPTSYVRKIVPNSLPLKFRVCHSWWKFKFCPLYRRQARGSGDDYLSDGSFDAILSIKSILNWFSFIWTKFPTWLSKLNSFGQVSHWIKSETGRVEHSSGTNFKILTINWGNALRSFPFSHFLFLSECFPKILTRFSSDFSRVHEIFTNLVHHRSLR